MTLRPLFRRWRNFWQSLPARAYGSHLPESNDGITRLSALAPTVKDEEVVKLYSRPRTNPAEFIDRLPIG